MHKGLGEQHIVAQYVSTGTSTGTGTRTAACKRAVRCVQIHCGATSMRGFASTGALACIQATIKPFQT
eukprot:15048-Pelagomonas_calceolata.AAC.1